MFTSYGLPCFSEGCIEEYKCDLMIKGYEFSNDGLSEAIIKNDKEAVELFVKADININLPDNEGYSALDRALKVKDKEAVIFLCRAGGETKVMQIPDEFVQIATDTEVENNSSDIQDKIDVKKIAVAESVKNAAMKSSDEKTADEKPADPQMNKLCELVNENLIEDVATIAKNSPDLNKLTGEGLAPIHYAVFNDNPSMVHLLLGAGAYVNKKTSDGLTPLDIAILNDQKIVARVIMEYGGSMSTQVARELMKFGCSMQHDEISDLYDASFENIFSAMARIQQKLNSQK